MAGSQAACAVSVKRLSACAMLIWLAACSSDKRPPDHPVTPENHPFFPITPGAVHELGRVTAGAAMSCESCHPASSESFTDIVCLDCHTHRRA